MNSKLQSVARTYDEIYRSSNFFKYRPWIFRPFIRSLIRKTRLTQGSRVIDIGCGQGFFTSLFAGLGMDVSGVDISAEAIRSATENYGFTGAKFEVGDVMNLPYKSAFDCVFVRSCSLYNSADFEGRREVTDVLLQYIKPGGTLIFAFNTKLCPSKNKPTWRYLSFAAVKNHFSFYPDAKVYFSTRLDTVVLRSLAFSYPITQLASLASWVTGLGGDLVAIVRKS